MKLNTNTTFAIILIIFLFYLSRPATVVVQDNTGGDSLPINSLIDAGVAFTGHNKYVTGTALTDEYVRAFRLDGQRIDLGIKSLNSGTLPVTPDEDYKFYFFMNSTGPTVNYYVDIMDYTAKIQESTDDLVGEGCQIDTSPTISVRNPSGATQTSRTNAYSLGAASSASFEIDIRANSNKCYGTPEAPRGNIICFSYDSTYFTTVESNTASLSIPASISGLTRNSDQNTLSCYEFDLLEDTEKTTLTIDVTSNADAVHNISIYTDDIGFDLDATTLEEIWDYTDESANQLARILGNTPDGYIYVS